jgi:uncharacterized protein (DUF885 family)
MLSLAAAVAALVLSQPPTPAEARPLAPQPPHAAVATRPSPSAALRTILDEHVEFLKRNDPVGASTKGDDRFGDQLPDESSEAVESRRAELAARLARLESLDASSLSAAERTDAAILRYDLSTQVSGSQFHREQMPISTMGGPQLWLPQMSQQLPFTTPKHYADYASRLGKVARLIDQEIDQMKRGLAAGRVPPKVTMLASLDQCLAQCSPDIEKDPTLSPFYRPFLSRPAADPDASRARAAISSGVIPAYRRLASFLKDEYIPRCRDTVGASQGVDGQAAYDHAIRAHTTVELTADQVHALGLSEVARIQSEMLEVIARTDFPRKNELKGDALLTAFTDWLRREPRFYYQTEGELLDGYRVIAKKIDAELPRLFKTLPRNTYGVRPLPDFAAASSPAAYYYPGSLKGGVPGFFMANTLHLDQRPKYSMTCLTLHEAVPGHHLQISLADELDASQHEYHRWIGFTAFVEGWALYSERLGLEMGDNPMPPASSSELAPSDGPPPRGLYATPYDDFGRLSFEMWRACRLVIDTGIHAKNWSRQQAIDYLLAHTGLTKFDAEREIDRYISWPGQACGYKIGELRIRALRAEAQQKLGPAFDIREFHDQVLSAGAIPLPVLEDRIHHWLEEPAKH